MNQNRTHRPGVATACGLLLALLLIAGAFAIDAFWDQFLIVVTPDGPAAVPTEVAP